ncbi:MAG: VanZ family protein [Bacteroidota bacterium]
MPANKSNTQTFKLNLTRPHRKELLLRWLPLLIWMLTIFILSDQDKDETGKTSGFVMWLISFLPLNPEFVEQDAFKIFVRKAAHCTEYFILSMLMFRLLWWYMERRSAYIWAIILSSIYAMTDEFHQQFVPGRGASIMDVGIDTMGAGLGVLLIWALYQGKKKRHGLS